MPETSTAPATANQAGKFLPPILLAALLALAGFGIWDKASKAILPPLFDALEYHQKAANCWKALHTAGHTNLLNVAPVTRPPGTLLVSHPFGFSQDFRGFLFRTVFVPLVIVLLSLWFLLEADGAGQRRRWIHCAAVLGVAGLPLFHHLETQATGESPTYWGLVDTFTASLTVLAVALLLASARRLSLRLFTAGACAAVLTLLVKPVGLVLMPFIFWHWIAEMFAVRAATRNAPHGTRVLRNYTVAAVLIFFLVCSAVVLLCMNSDYLRMEAIRYFRNATAMAVERTRGHCVERLLLSFHFTLGWHWAAVLACILAARAASLFRGLKTKGVCAEDIRFFAAFAALCAGIWWILSTAGPFSRYLEPFLLTFAVTVIPDVVKSAASWPPRLRLPLGIACSTPFLLIVALLLSHHPPRALQRLAGVNLSTGGFAGEIALGQFLMDESARAGHRNLAVYHFAQDARKGMVGCSAIGYAMQRGTTPGFYFTCNLDWVRPTVIRRQEIVNADYVLFSPCTDPVEADRRLAQRSVPDWRAEEMIFEAWLTRAGAAEGLEPAGATTLRLLKVADRTKFDAAFAQFMGAHEWRPLFNEENAKPAAAR